MLTSLGILLGLAEILLTLVVIFAFFVLVRVYTPDTGRRARTAIMAVLFAGSVIYSTAFPVQLAPGVIADARGALLTLANLYGGPVAGAATLLASEIHRATLGGSGVYAGLIGNALAAGVGLAGWWWVTDRQQARRPRVLTLLACALGVTTTTLLSFLLIRPFGQALDLLGEAGPALAIVQFVSVLVLGGLLRVEFDARETRRQLRFQQAALDAHAHVARLTAEGDVAHVNANLCRLSGYAAAELAADPRRFLGSAPDAVTGFDTIWDTVRNGETWNGEICNQDAKGGRYVLEATAVPFVAPNGRVEHVVVIATNVTARVATAQELFEAKRAAESANRSKSEFLANMSHELRTPLNAIMGFADILRQEVFGPLGNTRYRAYAGDINEAARYLYNLINDILDISRIEAGSVTAAPETLQPPEIAETCTRMVEQRAQRKAIRLCAQVPPETPPIYADGSHVKQMLTNLLTNAVKYTDTGGEIRLTAEVADGDRLVLAVHDTGHGIPPDKLEEIQEPFVQIHRTTGQTSEGVGLGLFLVKKLAEVNGGRMDIASTLGAGTVVRITLPRAETQRDPPVASQNDGMSRISAAGPSGSPRP